jgi:GH43 family beta-xylosidase
MGGHIMVRASRYAFVMLLLIVGVWVGNATPVRAGGPICAFRNPLMIFGQDPSVVFHEGLYYLVQSNNADYSIGLRQSATLSGLGSAPLTTIWSAPPNTNYSLDIWAPELISLQGHFYIYFAADDGDNNTHRMYTLTPTTDDLLGPWEFKGPVFKTPELDKWAIDLSAFEYNDKLYAVWSGSHGDEAGATFPQVIYIAEMDDPLTVTGDRVEILVPTNPYESSVEPIAEGPEPYIHNGSVSIVYSADASWTRHYKLAMIHLEGNNPLDANAWVKKGPVFSEVTTNKGSVYGVGHNSLPVPSPDGTEWWQVYHSKTIPTDGWDDRDIRMQEMTWNADGTPNFGTPIPSSVAQAVPSGEPCGLQASFSFNEITADDNGADITVVGDPTLTAFEDADGSANLAVSMNGDDALDTGKPLLSTTGSYSITARVMLTESRGDYTFVAQEGGLFSAFRLHTTDDGHAAFTTYNTRGDVAAEVVSADPLNSNTWYDLAAVTDAITGEIALYVNDDPAVTAPFNEGWVSLKSLVIGTAKEKGKRQHYLIGTVDDVFVYDGALTANDIAALDRP